MVFLHPPSVNSIDKWTKSLFSIEASDEKVCILWRISSVLQIRQVYLNLTINVWGAIFSKENEETFLLSVKYGFETHENGLPE